MRIVYCRMRIVYYILYYIIYVLPQTPGGFRRCSEFLQEQTNIPAGIPGKPFSPVCCHRFP